MYPFFFKRIIDLSIAVIGIIVLSPIMFVVIILNAISLKGNPFFTQARPGKSEKKIFIIKFKSMNDDRDSEGKLLPDVEFMSAREMITALEKENT
jgi:undecaprenyl phosphate N,N'-diacetylbacillosamine 1-phosphate transferase